MQDKLDGVSLKEVLDIYNDGLNNINTLAMDEILRYVSHKRDSFPLLSEFY